ncbi:MAG: hypothetical protein HY591_04795 [Candidatus Omnitrophica bacterium]|nr:hypothetical protein [Candidatus Omnitrophota bacterium]
MRNLIMANGILLTWTSRVLAQAPEEVVNSFSTRMIDILKGPIAKVLGAVILLAGVASLLRGRHKLAVSCGLAFIVLLFLPILLQQVANGNGQ